MKTRRGLIVMIAVVLSALVLMATGIAMAATPSQHWKLDNDKQMERETGLGNDGQSDSVSIPKSTTVIWLADEAAQPATGVTFPNGSWVTHLCLDSNWSGNMTIRVGSWDGANFTPFTISGTASMTWDSGKQQLAYQTQTGSETIAQNDYLALEITNNDANSSHSIMTNGCSELQSPCSDPGYPTPEIATGIMVALGVLGLAGYVFIRRKQTQDVLA
ncbi:MAG: hypothetical protein PHV74_03170 [Dehalococcoidia bacterium]|nr:hypothetical protein [Dehalococcoidia bacterium]